MTVAFHMSQSRVLMPYADDDLGLPVRGVPFASRNLVQSKKARELLRSFASKGM